MNAKRQPSANKLYRRFVLLAPVLFMAGAFAFAAEENPLVELKTVAPNIRLEIRYASKDNFMKEQLYPSARCFLRKEVAEKIARVQQSLEKQGLGLKIFDGYRPLSVQKKMWERFPVEGYVANPAKGSNHNRGAAVDLTLVDKDGKELEMPSAYDEFSERSHRNFTGATPEQTKNRELLESEMIKEGFIGLSTEWWHFDDANAKQYPVLDIPIPNLTPES